MRNELDDLLCERYPDLFCNRHASPFESGMHYGFTCGHGWFDLIERLCAAISAKVRDGSSPPVVARQVKEKLGRLRFRFRGGDDEIRRLVLIAEELSETTCEICGGVRSCSHQCKSGDSLPEVHDSVSPPSINDLKMT